MKLGNLAGCSESEPLSPKLMSSLRTELKVGRAEPVPNQAKVRTDDEGPECCGHRATRGCIGRHAKREHW